MHTSKGAYMASELKSDFPSHLGTKGRSSEAVSIDTVKLMHGTKSYDVQLTCYISRAPNISAT